MKAVKILMMSKKGTPIVLTFTTNKNGTFSPVIATLDSSVGIWNVTGETPQVSNSPSFTLTGADETVDLTIADFAEISNFIANDDGIKGVLDLSLITSCALFELTTNPALTGITFPAVTVTVTKVYIRGSTIITAIDLTDLGSNLGGDLRFDGCSSLSSITIPSTSNLVNFFIANNCALSGTFSLANLTNLSNYIDLAANSGLTGITFPSVTNIISSILLNNCGLTSLDISNLQNSGGTLFANTNPALTSLTLPSASSQNMTSFRVQSCNLSSLDLSGYNAVSGVVFAFGNSNLSSISFPSSTAAISFMWLYSCAFTSLDFSSLNLGGNINISSNTGLTML